MKLGSLECKLPDLVNLNRYKGGGYQDGLLDAYENAEAEEQLDE